MPDLMVIAMYHCASAEQWQQEYASRSRDYVTHTVTYGPTPCGDTQFDYSCTCEKFHFKGECHHIEEARGERCGWMQVFDGGEPVLFADGTRHCPQCGEPVKCWNWGV